MNNIGVRHQCGHGQYKTKQPPSNKKPYQRKKKKHTTHVIYVVIGTKLHYTLKNI